MPGASGVPGATGPQGPQGATGASGGTGGTGGPGTTSWNDITDKPGAILNYKGTWNVSSNSPTLSDSTGSGGDVYRVSVGGSRNLGSGTISWEVGDYAIWSPVTSSWEKADTTDAVSSVAGRTGAVTLTSADLGASGSASSSTFLRGDNTWATPAGITRSVQTITSPTTLGNAANTDYVVFSNMARSTDSSFSNVSLLLNMNGANNSTSLVDESNNNWSITANGNAKISTAQSKFGGSSAYFDGTDDYLSFTSNTTTNFGTGDFCFETWMRLDTIGRSQCLIAGTAANSFGVRFGTGFSPSSPPTNGLNLFRAGADFEYCTFTFVINTWYHIAVVRQSSVIKFFVDGTQITTQGSGGSNYNFPAEGAVRIGTSDILGEDFQGYLDDLRVTKAARYTGNFTAPTAELPGVSKLTLPTAVSNTNEYRIRNIHGSDSLTVGTTSSQTIDGSSTLTLSTGSAARTLFSDGSNWRSM